MKSDIWDIVRSLLLLRWGRFRSDYSRISILNVLLEESTLVLVFILTDGRSANRPFRPPPNQ